MKSIWMHHVNRVKERSLAQDINNLLNHLSHFIHLAFFEYLHFNKFVQ